MTYSDSGGVEQRKFKPRLMLTIAAVGVVILVSTCRQVRVFGYEEVRQDFFGGVLVVKVNLTDRNFSERGKEIEVHETPIRIVALFERVREFSNFEIRSATLRDLERKLEWNFGNGENKGISQYDDSFSFSGAIGFPRNEYLAVPHVPYVFSGELIVVDDNGTQVILFEITLNPQFRYEVRSNLIDTILSG